MSVPDPTPEGEALRGIREKAGLSRRVVAERLDIGIQQLRWWEIRGPQGDEESRVRAAVVAVLEDRGLAVGATASSPGPTRQSAPGGMQKFRCPGCQTEVEALGSSSTTVKHRCPNGGRWKDFQRVT